MILPSARWNLAKNRSAPSRTSSPCPAALIAKELIEASPPKYQPKPGRSVAAPESPYPATRPQPRSGLQAIDSSRFTLAYSTARSSSESGEAIRNCVSRIESACATRRFHSRSAAPGATSERYSASAESCGIVPPASTIGTNASWRFTFFPGGSPSRGAV